MTHPVADRLTAALADRYRIERELGQGGMATVYLAQDLRHARQVAIKVLRPELAAVIGAERFPLRGCSRSRRWRCSSITGATTCTLTASAS